MRDKKAYNDEADGRSRIAFGTRVPRIFSATECVGLNAATGGIEAIVPSNSKSGQADPQHGAMRSIEPEVNIKNCRQGESRRTAAAALSEPFHLVWAGQQVMLKLSLPTVAIFTRRLVNNAARHAVVALSGAISVNEQRPAPAQ